MDPADNGRAPAGQGSQTALLEQGLAAVFQAVHELSQHMAQLAINSAQAGAIAPPTPPPEPPIYDPFCWGLKPMPGFSFSVSHGPGPTTPSASNGTVLGLLRSRTVTGPRAKLGSGPECQWDPGDTHDGGVPAARRTGIRPAGLCQQGC